MIGRRPFEGRSSGRPSSMQVLGLENSVGIGAERRNLAEITKENGSEGMPSPRKKGIKMLWTLMWSSCKDQPIKRQEKNNAPKDIASCATSRDI
jgi:hypothetical protein